MPPWHAAVGAWGEGERGGVPTALGRMCSAPLAAARHGARPLVCGGQTGEAWTREGFTGMPTKRGWGDTTPSPTPPASGGGARHGAATPRAPALSAPPTAVFPEPHAHRARRQQRHQTGHPPPPPPCMARAPPPPTSSRPAACASRPAAPTRARPPTTYPPPAERGAGRRRTHPPWCKLLWGAPGEGEQLPSAASPPRVDCREDLLSA